MVEAIAVELSKLLAALLLSLITLSFINLSFITLVSVVFLAYLISIFRCVYENGDLM